MATQDAVGTCMLLLSVHHLKPACRTSAPRPDNFLRTHCLRLFDKFSFNITHQMPCSENELINITTFLNDITLHSSAEKVAFFRCLSALSHLLRVSCVGCRSLTSKLQQCPPSVIGTHLVRRLLDPQLFIEENYLELLVPLFTPNRTQGVFDEEDFVMFDVQHVKISVS